jgi:hypothetical protein
MVALLHAACYPVVRYHLALETHGFLHLAIDTHILET